MNVDQVIKHFGGEMEAATALCYSLQSIKNWESTRKIPNSAQRYIERATNGKLKADKVAK